MISISTFVEKLCVESHFSTKSKFRRRCQLLHTDSHFCAAPLRVEHGRKFYVKHAYTTLGPRLSIYFSLRRRPASLLDKALRDCSPAANMRIRALPSPGVSEWWCRLQPRTWRRRPAETACRRRRGRPFLSYRRRAAAAQVSTTRMATSNRQSRRHPCATLNARRNDPGFRTKNPNPCIVVIVPVSAYITHFRQ